MVFVENGGAFYDFFQVMVYKQERRLWQMRSVCLLHGMPMADGSFFFPSSSQTDRLFLVFRIPRDQMVFVYVSLRSMRR